MTTKGECSLCLLLHHGSVLKMGREPPERHGGLSEVQVAWTSTTQDGVKEAEIKSDGAKVTDLKVFPAVAFCLSSSDPHPSLHLFSQSHDLTG